MVSSWKLCQKTISVRLVEMLKDQGVKNNGLTFLEEINSEWVILSRLKVHPRQQVLEARVVQQSEALFSRKIGKARLLQSWGSDRFRSFTTGNQRNSYRKLI